jgi:hypothetical protein
VAEHRPEGDTASRPDDEVVIDLRMQQLTLEASLAAMSSVVQRSLVEFLR